MMKQSRREKELTAKILCSLLMASTISFCLSGGEAWASSSDLAAQGQTQVYTEAQAEGNPKLIGGWDLYSGHATELDHTSVNTNITLNSGKFDEIIGGNAIKRPDSDSYNLTINDTKVTMNGGEVSYVIGGSKANNSDNTTLVTGNTDTTINGGIVNGMATGGNYIKSTGNVGAGIPAATTATTGNINLGIAGGTINGNVYAGSVAENYGTVQTEDKPSLSVTDESTNMLITGGTINGDVYGGGAAMGAESTSKVDTASINITGGTINGDVYAGGYADKGGKSEVGNASLSANNVNINGSIFGTGNAVDGESTANINGSVNISLDNVKVAGAIALNNANQKLVANDLTVTEAEKVLGNDRYTGIFLSEGAEATFTGSKTEILIDSDAKDKVAGIHLKNGAQATFSAAQTIIDAKGIGASSQWGYGLALTNGASTATFNGGEVIIKNYQDQFTSQTLTAKAGSVIDFNNTGNVLISSESPYGVTAVDNQGGKITFNNTGKVDIVGTILPGDKTGQTNVVGIQSQEPGSQTMVTDKVKDFTITLTGAGVDNDGTSYSSGTNGISLQGSSSAEINSQKFNIIMNIAENVEDVAPGEHTAEKAYGINLHYDEKDDAIEQKGGTLKVGASTDTNINIKEGLGTAYGINSEGKNSVAEVLGNTTITAIGKEGSNALQAQNGGTITVGSLDKTVNLTGDVAARDASIALKGQVSIQGQVGSIAKNGNSKITVEGDSLIIADNKYGSAVNMTSNSSKTVENNMSFNAKEISIATEHDVTAYGISVNNNGQPDGANTNKLTFTGDKLTLKVVSKNNKATGVRIGQSNYGDVTTDIQFNSQATDIIVQGTAEEKINGQVNVYDQVAGIWEGSGSFKDGTKTTVAFTGKTNITVNSADSHAYGVYLKGDKGSSTVDFKGDTTISAHNGTELGTALYASGANRTITVGSTGKTVNLTGDLVAENKGEINIGGKTNTINGMVKALGGGIVNLNGASDAVYNNININSFTTTNSGKVNLNGGTINFGNLNNSSLEDNSFVVKGGSLASESVNIFTTGLTDAGTTIDSGAVLDAVNKVIDFESGKLILTDSKYNLDYLAKAKESLNTADTGSMNLVVTGTLVDSTGEEQKEVAADSLANTGTVHAGVTGTVADKDVTIGTGGGLEGLGVKDLAMGGTANEASTVTVANDKELTLVGGGNENEALIKTGTGETKTNVAVAVGSNDNAGKLNLGVAGVSSGGNLNAAVAIGHADSTVNVDAGAFKVNTISAEKGTINVNEGAELKTESLTIGSSGSTVTLSGTGTLAAETMTITQGTVDMTGTTKTDKLTVDSSAKINVGTGASAGSLAAKNVNLNGAAVVLDPVWQGNDQIGDASKAALAFTNNNVNGLMTVGRNSVLSLGTDLTQTAEDAFGESGLNWGEQGITAALYIDKAQTLDASGGILVDGTKTAAAASANKAEFAAGSLLIVNGAGIGRIGTAALSGATSSTLKVDAGAKLHLTGTNAGIYTIADKFDTNTINGWTWSTDVKDVTVNKLSEIESAGLANGKYTVTVKQADIKQKYNGIALGNILQAMDQNKTEYAGIKYLTGLADIQGITDSEFVSAVNNFATRAEQAGASHSSIMATSAVGNLVQEHVSFAADNATVSGGKGASLANDNAGSNIWAQYVHSKDDVSGLGGASFDAQYNGVVVGTDFKTLGKYQSGAAFSYGSGSSTDASGKDEYDSWGMSYYGSIKNDSTNFIFDVGYSQTDHDIKGVVHTEPKTKIITAAVKGEKLFANGHGTRYIPYAGLRYMNINNGSYKGTINGQAAIGYDSDKANVWLLPLGVNISHENITNNGWKLRPYVDLAYVFVMGDKRNEMTVTVPGVDAADRVGYELMDSNFFSGRLGLEAQHKNITYGVGYGYQKSSHTKNDKWFVNLEYSF